MKTSFLFLLLTTVSVIAEEDECDAETREAAAYLNWPMTLDCSELMSDLVEIYYDYGHQFYTCTIIDMSSEVTLLNATFDYEDELPDVEDFKYKIERVTNDTSTQYKMIARADDDPSICLAETIQLNIIEFSQQSCLDSIEHSDVIVEVSKWVGATNTFLCHVPSSSEGPSILINPKDEEDAVSYWLYNCGRDLPNNTRPSSDPNEPDALLVHGINYDEHPGVYTCVVEFKGMKRYRVHYKTCVKDQVSSEVSLTCPDRKVAVGGDVEIICDVDAGLGQANRIAFHSIFNKLDENGLQDPDQENVSCVSSPNNEETQSRNKRFSCEMSLHVGNLQCFYDPPSKDEITAQMTKLKMAYKIKNVQESDFGEYRATVYRFSTGNSTVFRLSLDQQPGLERSTIIIIVCMSVLLGVGLFVLMLFCLCGIEIRWVWKHNFGSREREIKKYAAYLAYYYSKDMSNTSPAQLEAFVMNLNTRIQRLGGKLYDKCREPHTKQYIADDIQAKLTECHRVIIILTPEYIQDQWSVYEAYEAWKNVIENGIPIVFITFPSTAAAIASLNEESRIALNNALKRHRVIEWKGVIPFSRRMRMRLEIFMPKLPREGALNGGMGHNLEEVTIYQNVNTPNGALDNNGNIHLENAL